MTNSCAICTGPASQYNNSYGEPTETVSTSLELARI